MNYVYFKNANTHIISEIKEKKNFNFLDIVYLEKYLFSRKKYQSFNIFNSLYIIHNIQSKTKSLVKYNCYWLFIVFAIETCSCVNTKRFADSIDNVCDS